MRTACVCLLEVTRAQRGSSPRRQECCCRLGTASSRYGLSSSWYGTACWRSRGPRGALLGVRSLSSSTPSLDRFVRDLLCVGKWTPDAFPRRDRSQGLSSSSPVLCHEGPEELSSCVLFPVRDREGGGFTCCVMSDFFCLSSRRQGHPRWKMDGVWLLLGRPSDGSWASLLCALPEVVWVVVPVVGRQLSS